ncbi:MAG: bifunctional nicotinamidase/pyrazinamidase [Coriobacteriales bacterium]|jgi:nicotinamidase/pyrazinamidase|nr:bifunctional nicotinamidase/pyrazinamidase [Coriobacteriales bacterium]
MAQKVKPRKALILVDIQNDFCPGGALAVDCGDEIVAVANRLAYQFVGSGDIVVATRDQHPANHGSFASSAGVKVGDIGQLGGVSQVFWPDHCVEGSPGAGFHPDLRLELIDQEFAKGTDKAIDSYSGFYDNDHQTSTGLAEYLREQDVKAVTIIGLATDYCVAATARDAQAEGFDTTVVAEGCRAVDINPGDGERALAELRKIGVKVV